MRYLKTTRWLDQKLCLKNCFHGLSVAATTHLYIHLLSLAALYNQRPHIVPRRIVVIVMRSVAVRKLHR
jgi:hypothetical protein